MQAYVGGFLFGECGTRVALVEKQTPQWQKGLLNAIGGKVDTKEENGIITHIETPIEAMVREFEEETGVYIPPTEWKYKVHLIIPNISEIFFFSCFSDVIDEVRTIEDEKIIVEDIDVVLTHRPIVPNIKWLLPLCYDEDVAGPVEVVESYAEAI